MKNADIHKHLEDLREEMRSLNASLARIDPEDVRTAFGDQTKLLLMERIEKFFQKKVEEAGRSERDARLKAQLTGIVELTDKAVRGRSRDDAMIALDQMEGIFLLPSKEYNLDRRRFVLNIISQARWCIDDSDDMVQQVVPPANDAASPAVSSEGTLSPATVEWALGPLANSKRVRILQILSEEDERLTDLCELMGMQKGHLQYHLKTLMSTRYVMYDRKSRLYSITNRGTVALDNLAKLTQDILST